MCTLEVKRSCICITHPSLLDRLAWGPVMQKQISTSFRAVSVISPAAVIIAWSHLIRCILACEVLVITRHSCTAHELGVHLYYPSEDASSLGMGTCDAETALDQFTPGEGR